MKKFEVRWTERHCLIVEADNEEDAKNNFHAGVYDYSESECYDCDDVYVEPYEDFNIKDDN